MRQSKTPYKTGPLAVTVRVQQTTTSDFADFATSKGDYNDLPELDKSVRLHVVVVVLWD